MRDKDAKFIEAKLEGKNDIDAAMAATGTTSRAVANTQAYRIKNRPPVKTKLQQSLKRYKIDEARLLSRLNDALDAEKLIVMGKDSNDSFIDRIPDHAIRLKAVDMLLKLLPKDKEDTKDKPHVFDNEMLKELLASGNLVELQRIMLSKDSS